MKKQTQHRGIKCSPYNATFDVSMKLRITNLVLSHSLLLTTEQDLVKNIIIMNSEDIEDEDATSNQLIDWKL